MKQKKNFGLFPADSDFFFSRLTNKSDFLLNNTNSSLNIGVNADSETNEQQLQLIINH